MRESNCVTSWVCLSGACLERPTPDGAPCGTDSPCQPQGVCSDQSCLLPPPTPLEETWSWTAQGQQIVGPPLVDADGDLRVQTGDGDWWSRKRWGLTRAGSVTYVRPDPFHATPPPLLESGLLIGGVFNHIRAIDAETGVDDWLVDTNALLSAHLQKSVTRSQVLQGGAWSTGNGQVTFFVSEEECVSCQQLSIWPVRLEATSGQVLQVGPSFWTLGGVSATSDESGHVFLNRHSPYGLHAVPVSGNSTWVRMDITGAHLASWNGVVAGQIYSSGDSCWHLATLDAATGTEHFRRPNLYLSPGPFHMQATLRASDEAWFAVGTFVPEGDTCGILGDWALVRFDPLVGDVLWWRPVEGFSDQLVVTDRRSLLYSQQDQSSGRTVLHHVDFDGRQEWTCDLPAQANGIVGLHEGRAFLRTDNGLSAIELPGLDMAESGWLTEWGDRNHRRRPQISP